MHIQRHTHTSTYVQSAHKRNGDNQAQEPVERGGRKALLETLHTHTQKQNKKQSGKKTDTHESKRKDSST